MKRMLMVGIAGAFVFAAGAEDIVAEDEAVETASSFDRVYFGLGLGGSFLKNTVERNDSGTLESFEKQKVNRFMGNVAFGGSKVFGEKFYLGGEIFLDLAKSQKKDLKYNGAKLGEAESRGTVFGIGIPFGYTINEWLVYLKPAISFPKVTGKDNSNKEVGSVSKAAWSIALGVEKPFCQKFSGRLEGEYRFKASKTFDGNVKIKTGDGFNIRAIVAYSVKY